MTDTLTKDQGEQTPLNDLVAAAIDRMKAGARMTLSDIPGDASLSSSSHRGDVSAAIATLALEALEMRPHVAQFGEGKLEVILGELECEGNVYVVPAKHQGKVGEITPPELRAARDQWHDGEIVLRFPNQLQALMVAAALTNINPEDWVFEQSQSPISSLPKVTPND